MVDIYLDSNASGANDGTSFTDAFTELSSVSPNVNDVVLVASDHSESITGNAEPGGNSTENFYYMVSVNSSTELYEKAASVQFTVTGEFGLSGGFAWGINVDCAGNLENNNGLEQQAYRDCTIECDEIGSNSGNLYFEDCDLTFTNTGVAISVPSGQHRFVGGTISTSGTTAELIRQLTQGAFATFEGVDFNGATFTHLLDGSATGTRGHGIVLDGCRLPNPGSDFVDRIRGSFLEIINCISGTSANPILQYRFFRAGHSSVDDTSIFRSGGASDGITPYSLEVTALGNATKKGFRPARALREGVTVLVSPGDTTVTAYVAHGGVGAGTAGALQSDQCWLEYLGPSESVSPVNSAYRHATTAPDFGVTPTDLTSDASVWSGSGVGTTQRIELTIDPTVTGYARVNLAFAPESGSDQTIFFDPRIEVS